MLFILKFAVLALRSFLARRSFSEGGSEGGVYVRNYYEISDIG